MPQIPAQSLPSVAPTGAAGVFQRIDVDPNAFGAGVASAGMGLSRAVGGFGDVEHETALKAIKQYNETATDEANVAFEGKVRDTLFGQDGFYSKRGSDAMKAMQPTATALEQLRVDTRENLSSPEQKRMFDYMSRRSAARELYQMQAHANTEFNTWQGDTAKGAIANEVNNSATYWNDNQRFAESLGNIKIQTSKLLQLKGIDPESDTGKAEIQHYTGEAWQARIRSVMAQSPDVARELFDANADQIDAAHRATLDSQITQHQYTALARSEAEDRRAEANARRDMQTTQGANLASLTADVMKGKPVDWGRMADMVRSQQLAPHVPEFLMSLQNKRRAGPEEDRADAVIALHTLLNDPDTSIGEKTQAISDAAKHGAIKAATAGTLVDQAFKSDGRAETSTQRDAKAAMLAAGGVPDGLINLGHEEKQRKAQMLVEWQDRMSKGEDPIDVRDDMINRYSPPGTPPATWARPRFGPVTSTLEVAQVAARTKQALANGQITPEKAAAEGVLLNQYAGFYQRLEAANAVAAAARAQKAPGGAKAKAKLTAVQPAQGDQ